MKPSNRGAQILACLLAAAWLGACHDTAAPEPSSTAAPLASASSAPRAVTLAPELGPHQSPVTVALHGPDRVTAGQDVELWAEVEQLAGSEARVSLSLQLPEGVRLVSGEPSEMLPSGNRKLVRHFVVHVDQVPSTDIEAVASTQSMAFGAHARSAYRFGRPEPRFSEPERREKRLKVAGKDVGRPILLHPQR
ncbi:MAG TPA: hypothetical protein VHB79_27110 [Polyangiaceae bacterium]|nr:hypothetical protein [Polyangiaceae bacterium]